MAPLVLLEPRELLERSAPQEPLDPRVEQGLQDRTALWVPRVQLEPQELQEPRVPRGQLGGQGSI